MERPEFRSTQGVVPFGVGAIIDFTHESLMSAGLDMWPYEQADPVAKTEILKSCQVLDGRLATRLSHEFGRPIRFFLSPTEAPDFRAMGAAPRLDRAPMPFVRFPNWYFCPRCRVLKDIPWNTQSRADSLRCNNSGRRTEGKADPCAALPLRRRPRLSPVRFVVACENGHIMDFPWSDWAHGDRTPCPPEQAKLYLYSTTAAGLAGVVVKCVSCNSHRSMAGAFQKDALRMIFVGTCPGERPWLGPDGRETCTGGIPQTIQRGASNAYFASLVSSILIPPYSARVQQVLDRPDIWDEIQSVPMVEGRPHEPFLRTKARNLGLDPDAFVGAVLGRLSAAAQPEESEGEVISEERYRFDEYQAYLGPRPPVQERHDFDTKRLEVGLYADWFAELFDAVVLVQRLRETRVLTGFSRIVPPGATSGGLAKLSLVEKPWLPGFSVRGEGIFLQLSQAGLAEWSGRGDLLHRTAAIQQRLDRLADDRGQQRRRIIPSAVLIHTLAHLMIRQLAYECGYDASSIRERLYVSPAPETMMAGLLLYTASGDSEGTLGGLVRQGEPGRLDNTLLAALRNASICSSDPLCMESEGQGTHALNLAACHACALLPETSCEEGNLLLDRVMVLGESDKPEIGYFASAPV